MALTQVVNLFSRPPVGLLGRADTKNPNQVPTSYLMTDLFADCRRGQTRRAHQIPAQTTQSNLKMFSLLKICICFVEVQTGLTDSSVSLLQTLTQL